MPNLPKVSEESVAQGDAPRPLPDYVTVLVVSILGALSVFEEEAQEFVDLAQGVIQRSEACMRSFMEKVADGREDWGEFIEDLASVGGTIGDNISHIQQFIEYFLAFGILAMQAWSQGRWRWARRSCTTPCAPSATSTTCKRMWSPSGSLWTRCSCKPTHAM